MQIRGSQTIRSKLDALVSRDQAMTVFGAAGERGHGYERRPVLSAPELADIESKLGVSLPDELACFLMRVHGGGAGPGYGLFVHCDDEPPAKEAQPFPFDDEDARAVIARRLSGDEEDDWASLEMPGGERDDDSPPGSGFLPIAHYGDNVYDVIVVTGEQRGRIWCYDTGWCPLYAAGKQLGLFDWYERWLDHSLAKVSPDDPA